MNILIIKPDHIGDYIVFRNFIEDIKKIPQFKNASITCLLNQRVKDLAEFLDDTHVDQFVFIELEKYITGEWYYTRKNKELNATKYDYVINAMLAHFDKMEEYISHLQSSKKFLIYEELYDPKQYFIKNYGPFYSDILNVSNIRFEYDKFRYAFSKIFDHEMKSNNIHLELKENPLYEPDFNFKYVTIFIGSDADYRKWNIFKYIDIIKYILESTSYHVILTGATLEYDDSMVIEQHIQSQKLHNLVNQTSLIDMLYIIKQSELIISNETGIAHMSMALEQYTLVVSNGNHFGKFTPYPEQYAKDKYFSVYPFEIKNTDDYEKYLQLYYKKSELDINIISVNSVLEQLQRIFSAINTPMNNSKLNYEKYYQSISFSQIKLNYEFSFSFSKSHEYLLELKKSQQTFLLYGDGAFAQFIKTILTDQIIGIIDKKYPESFLLLEESCFDKVLISVLGREDVIEKELVTTHHLPQEKIEKITITKAKYNVRTK